MATATGTMTTKELLAMPDDGVERWLIRGELREKSPEVPGVTMTVCNRYHCEVTWFVGGTLLTWVRTQPKPQGRAFAGEIGIILRTHEDTTVGADLAYVTPDVLVTQSDDESTLIVGVPTLVVEVLSPNDMIEQIGEKIGNYLDAGVPLVWEINPYRRTVLVHRPGRNPELFGVGQTMTAEPYLPGFAVPVIDFFE